MTDFLLCEACETLVSTNLSYCPCCKNHFKEIPYTAALLTFCQFIDDHANTLTIEKRLELIESSLFKNHPILRYKKARFTILKAMSTPETVNNTDFFNLLKMTVSACISGPHYWEDLVKLLTDLLPLASVEISMDEWHDIINLTKSNYKEKDQYFAAKLAMQIRA